MNITKNGKTLTIEVRECNPREATECMGTMICFHRRYILGDSHIFKNTQEFSDWCNENKDKIAIILPLYLYDHSGITISTEPFYDKWDSGQVGYIYTTKEDVKSFGYDLKDINLIKHRLMEEVEDYDAHLQDNFIEIYFSLFDDNTGYDYGTIYGTKSNMKELLNNISIFTEYPEFEKEVLDSFCEREAFME